MSDSRTGAAHAALRTAFHDAQSVTAREDWLDLEDPHSVWLVTGAGVDVFLVNEREGVVETPLNHVARIEEGGLLFGVESSAGGLRLKARALPGAVFRRAAPTVVLEPDAPTLADAVAACVDTWVEALSRLVAEHPPLSASPDVRFAPGQAMALAAGKRLAARRGIVWVSCDGGPPNLLDLEPGDAVLPTPVSPLSWLSVSADDRITGQATRQLVRNGELFAALDAFHQLALRTQALNLILAVADSANLQRGRAALRHRQTARARAELAAVARRPSQGDRASGSPLETALAAIGDYEGITFRMVEPRPPEDSPRLDDVLLASGVRARSVDLAADPRWWRRDSGALLGRRAEDDQPVGLIPMKPHGYRMVTAQATATEAGLAKSATRVNAARAAELGDTAWTFTRPLPERTGAKDVARIAFRNAALDLARFFVAGLLANLVAFAPAFVIRALVDRGFPEQDSELLWLSLAGLGMLAVLGLLLGLYQATALLRVEGRMALTTTAALWDRLLNLSATTFRGATAGELEQRAMTFHALRDKLVGIVARVTLSAIFLLPTFAVLFYFNTALAGAVLICGLAALAAVATYALLQRQPQRRSLAAMRLLAGNLFQFVSSIAKLRTTNAEEPAFALWARSYSQQKREEIGVAKLSDQAMALSATLPILMTAVLFLVANLIGDELSVGDFVATYAAAMVFVGAVGEFGVAAEAITRAVPELKQALPILEATPERSAEQDLVNVELRGALRIEHVSLQYPGSNAPTLHDVSLHAEPGEFVAIVGASGAGKSSLIRIALGLERPSAGSVFYDGRDLASMNQRSVRQQIGVVSQSDTLQPGTVLTNIIGVADDLDADDAWRAAEAAALADDITKMPMAMHTIVAGSSAFFSGGQIQRIHIARALVRNPRILLLDEPTSSLDAASQAKVLESLASLTATRLVVAHRESTIRHADRIYVIDRGRVVQTGTYRELMEVDGPLRTLLAKQLLPSQ